MNFFHYLLIIIVLMILWSLIERKLIGIKNYQIKSNQLGKEFHNTKFVVLADLHNCTFGKHNVRLIRKIERMKPDFILFAGDIITKQEICIPSSAYYLLENLAAKYTIYYAYGNHEQKLQKGSQSLKSQKSKSYDKENELYSSWISYKNKLTDLGVIFLDNQSTAMIKGSSSIRFTGLSIGSEYFKRKQIPKMKSNYVEKKVGKSEKSSYQILIAHNPIFFKEYIAWGADLVISGHVHGGMVRLPKLGGVISPQAKFFPEYDAGQYSMDGKEMIVSRGLGSHSIMPRLFNCPELISVTLISESL